MASRTAVAALLQGEDAERDHRGDQPGRRARAAEQQVQPDRRADELGQVGRHRDQLRLHPQAQADRPRQMVPAQFGQVPAGGHANFADRYCTSIAIRLAAR